MAGGSAARSSSDARVPFCRQLCSVPSHPAACSPPAPLETRPTFPKLEKVLIKNILGGLLWALDWFRCRFPLSHVFSPLAFPSTYSRPRRGFPRRRALVPEGGEAPLAAPSSGTRQVFPFISWGCVAPFSCTQSSGCLAAQARAGHRYRDTEVSRAPEMNAAFKRQTSSNDMKQLFPYTTSFSTNNASLQFWQKA